MVNQVVGDGIIREMDMRFWLLQAEAESMEVGG